MASEIVVVERTKLLDSSGSGAVRGWRVSGLFLYVFAPTLDTRDGPPGAPTGPVRIVPTPSLLIPDRWRLPASAGGLDLFRPVELGLLDSGDAVFKTFNETLTQEQAEDPGGAGADRLRELYAQLDPRDELRFRFAFAGARLDAV